MKWALLLRVLGRERTNMRVLGMFFKAVVQALILFWKIYMGDDPPHGPGPGSFPAPGGSLDHGDKYLAASLSKLGVPPLGVFCEGVGFVLGGGVRLEEE